MTARDNRGRFQNADVAAAERVIQRAVEEAIAILRLPVQYSIAGVGVDMTAAAKRVKAEVVLDHAAHAAEPLLRSAS